jgi:hypothetical protein
VTALLELAYEDITISKMIVTNHAQ